MNVQTKTAEPTVINGINVDDLFALIQGVKQDAAKGQTNWRVTTTWQGQARSRTQVEDFGIGAIPTLVVNGRYVVVSPAQSADEEQTFRELLALTDKVIALARGGAPRAAAPK